MPLKRYPETHQSFTDFLYVLDGNRAHQYTRLPALRFRFRLRDGSFERFWKFQMLFESRTVKIGYTPTAGSDDLSRRQQ